MIGSPHRMLELQRSAGNRAVERLLVQRDPQKAPPRAPMPNQHWVLPDDKAPLSAPGETVLFNAVFDGADPALYRLVLTGAGGTFDGAKDATVEGLESGNVRFVIDPKWDGKTAVTAKLELKRSADNSVLKSWDWTFGRKTRVPTTIAQQQPETELPLATTFDYKVGPPVGKGATADYGHETILETFEDPTSNLTLADVTDEWKKQNPGVKKDASLPGWFLGGSGANASFTVDADDKIHDQHGGLKDRDFFDAKLKTKKELWFDTVQTYSAQPGATLGRYRIRQILKPDGTKLVKKSKL